MTTVGNIIDRLNVCFPPERMEEWDLAGFNCGRRDAPVTKVLVALDPFSEACREAKDWGAELLVTHHTLLWNTRFLTDETETGRNALFLIENHIACFNIHTALDVAPEGVNNVLARTLGLSGIRVIASSGVDEQGREWGLLRQGLVPEQPLPAFCAHVREALGCPGLRAVSGGKPVHRVAVGGGGCAGAMELAFHAGCDTFVTADAKYNDFWDAKALGLSLIDAGHYYTEKPVCNLLADTIRHHFPEVEVRVSQSQRDCVSFL